MISSSTKDKIGKILFFATAMISVVAVALILFFLIINSIPALKEIGITNFLLGKTWKPNSNMFGIFPMIVGTAFVTSGALILGLPIGLFTAIYLAYYASPKILKLLKPAIQVLAGIPSIIFGFFCLMVIVPYIRQYLGGNGLSVLAAILLLSTMILPTIISVSYDCLAAVPTSYYEAGLALGDSADHVIFSVMIPAAKSGVLAACILGIGRAIGEAMGVVMIAGNQPVIPHSLLDGVRTMTSNIVLEMGYAADLHRNALIATGLFLFILVFIISIVFSIIKEREELR